MQLITQRISDSSKLPQVRFSRRSTRPCVRSTLESLHPALCALRFPLHYVSRPGHGRDVVHVDPSPVSLCTQCDVLIGLATRVLVYITPHDLPFADQLFVGQVVEVHAL